MSPARERLLDRAFGAGPLHQDAAQRLREGRLPADGLSFVATDDGASSAPCACGTSSAGRGQPALLLGPLAVAPERQSQRHRRHADAAAIARRAHARPWRRSCWSAMRPITSRFGFSARARPALLAMPGPLRARPAARRSNCVPGALDGARGTDRRDRARSRRSPTCARWSQRLAEQALSNSPTSPRSLEFDVDARSARVSQRPRCPRLSRSFRPTGVTRR